MNQCCVQTQQTTVSQTASLGTLLACCHLVLLGLVQGIPNMTQFNKCQIVFL